MKRPSNAEIVERGKRAFMMMFEKANNPLENQLESELWLKGYEIAERAWFTSSFAKKQYF